MHETLGTNLNIAKDSVLELNCLQVHEAGLIHEHYAPTYSAVSSSWSMLVALPRDHSRATWSAGQLSSDYIIGHVMSCGIPKG